MSSVVRAARHLREAESLALRKQIMKTSASGGGGTSSTDLFDRMADTGREYEDRIAQLQKFKTKSKAVTKTQTQQSEWKTEQAQLQRLADTYDRDIAAALEVLVLHSTAVTYLGDGDGDREDVHGIVDDDAARRADLFQHKKGLKFQLHELQMMLAEMVKGARKDKAASSGNTRSSKAGGPEKDENGASKVSGTSAASAVFADVLLQMRTQHAEAWAALAAEEQELWRAVKEDNRRVRSRPASVPPFRVSFFNKQYPSHPPCA